MYLRPHSPWWLPTFVVADLGGCRSSSHAHCPTPQAHDHVDLKQRKSINTVDVVGSSSIGSAAEDYLGSGQQGDSSANPEIDTIKLFCRICGTYMYVFPCVSCITSLLHTRLRLPRCILQ